MKLNGDTYLCLWGFSTTVSRDVHFSRMLSGRLYTITTADVTRYDYRVTLSFRQEDPTDLLNALDTESSGSLPISYVDEGERIFGCGIDYSSAIDCFAENIICRRINKSFYLVTCELVAAGLEYDTSVSSTLDNLCYPDRYSNGVVSSQLVSEDTRGRLDLTQHDHDYGVCTLDFDLPVSACAEAEKYFASSWINNSIDISTISQLDELKLFAPETNSWAFLAGWGIRRDGYSSATLSATFYEDVSKR